MLSQINAQALFLVAKPNITTTCNVRFSLIQRHGRVLARSVNCVSVPVTASSVGITANNVLKEKFNSKKHTEYL
jgi:hypothetical protein